MALTVFALRHLLVLAAIAATAWAAGTLASGALRRGASSVPWPFRIAFGLALLSQAALLLGLAGWLRAPIVAAAALGVSVAPYDHPRADYREFFRNARARGLDVRFGMAAAVMQFLAMAPLTAVAVLVMRRVLESMGFPARSLQALALLYGFGTPVFFRTGFLNQNLLVAHFALFARLRRNLAIVSACGPVAALWIRFAIPEWTAAAALMGLGAYVLIATATGEASRAVAFCRGQTRATSTEASR